MEVRAAGRKKQLDHDNLVAAASSCPGLPRSCHLTHLLAAIAYLSAGVGAAPILGTALGPSTFWVAGKLGVRGWSWRLACLHAGAITFHPEQLAQPRA